VYRDLGGGDGSVAEGFTCEVEGSSLMPGSYEWQPYRSACEGLDFYGEHEGKRYCVLHFPGEKKSEDFEGVKKSKLAKKDYDFGGTVFPEGTSDFEGHEFEGSTIFDGAAFLGGANFSRAQFSGKRTGFRAAKFSGEAAYFSDAKFSSEETDFTDTKFSGEGTSFAGAQFSGEGTDFRATQFSGEGTDFRATQFSAGATYFSEAQFLSANRTVFFRAQFSGVQVDFSEAQFSGEQISFSDAQFSAEATLFLDAKFSAGWGGTSFSEAQFIGEQADFLDAEFSGKGGTVFSEAQFSGKRASFHSAKFSSEGISFSSVKFSGGQADFSDAQFSGVRTYFSDAQFSAERTDFSEAQFSGEKTDFLRAKFSDEETSFAGAQFSAERTDFSEAQFSSAYTSFESVTFTKEVRFSAATFRAKVEFLGNSNNLVFGPQEWVWFNSHIVKPELLTFHTVLLHPGWFINADVRKVDFTDVMWYGMPSGPEGTLDKEIHALKDRDVQSPYTLLAQACRRLSANAEENREYPLANEFHYWAMDAVRKGSWGHFKGLTLRGLLQKETWHDIREHFGLITTWYWALSGYGVRAARAFWILVSIWLTFAALYFLLVQSSPFWVFSASNIWQGIDYARQAAVYSLSALVRLNPRPPSEELNWFQTLVTIEGILGPLQIALLVLAVRRKVMR
jgi:uncharacterized protein YjbI with pentapeptide repeats